MLVERRKMGMSSYLFESLIQHLHLFLGELCHLQQVVQGIAPETNDRRLLQLFTVCSDANNMVIHRRKDWKRGIKRLLYDTHCRKLLITSIGFVEAVHCVRRTSACKHTMHRIKDRRSAAARVTVDRQTGLQSDT